MRPWVSSLHAWLTGLLCPVAVILLAGLAEVAGAEPLACAFNQPSVVSVSGRQLVVARRRPDGSLDSARPYRMRGVNWAPASRGSGVDERQAQYAIWAATDIPLMREMNVNTVRVYLDFGVDQTACAVLDELHRHGIMAIVTVDLMVNDTANIARIVEAYWNHPAILMWSLGNEWNLNLYFSQFTGKFTTIDAAARATEQAAAQVKAIDPGHPVASSFGDIDIPSLTPLATTATIVNTVAPSVDVWGLNIYRGASLGTLFSQWASISSRPMFLGELGTDALDQTGQENQSLQADVDAGLWDEVAANLSADDPGRVAIGGALFEWNDEWWKAGNPSLHDTVTLFVDGVPAGFAHEEWFGLVDIDRNPRLAFLRFRTTFAAASCADDPARLPCVHRQLLDAAVPNTFPGVPTTPVAGVDGDGNIMVAWAYQFSIPGELYTARYDVATGWGPKTRLDTGAAQDRAFLPSLAVNRSGAALLAWSGQGGIYAAAYRPGSGWQPAATVVSHASDFLPFADRLEVTIDGAGNGLLVWSENTSQLLSSRYVAGSGWTAPEVVADRGGFVVSGFTLAADRSGNATLLWNHKPAFTSGQFTLLAARRLAGGDWQPAVPLWTSDLPISSAAAADGRGGAMAVWLEDGVPERRLERRLFAGRIVAGSGWQPPDLVTGTGRPEGFVVDVDPSGNAVVSWTAQDFVRLEYTASISRYVDGAGWQGVEVVKRTSAFFPPPSVHVRLGDQGRLFAMWSSPLTRRLELLRFLPSTGWQAFDLAGDPVKGGAGGGVLATNADGAAVVTWMDSYTVFDGQYSNTFTDVYASRFSIPDVFTLTVAATGTGGGTVRSDPPGIICPPACVQSYDDGAVTLTASPAAGSVFSGWSGAGCTGTGTCTVTMNGSRTVTATFTSTRPDLIVASVSPAALEVAPGGRLAVTVTIRNQGEGQAGASTMRLYLSHDLVRGPGDRLLSPSQRFSALAPGGAETRTVAVAMPRAVRPGAYVVLACADDLRRVVERDETNNCAASPAVVTVAGPDLVVDALAPGTSSVVAGQVIVLTATLRNTGSLQAPSSAMRFYLAGQRQRGPTDLALRGTPFPNLGPGRAATRTVPVTIPMTAPAGAYFVLACADDLDRVAERDETDNCVASAAPITITSR